MSAFCTFTSTSGQTLAEALNAMLINNPQIRSSEAETEAQQDSIKLERARRLPQFSLSMRGGEEQFDNDLSSTTTETAALSLNATQLLYDGGFARSQVNAARYRYLSSTNNLADLRENLTLELALTYIDVIKYSTLIDLAEENVRAHRTALSKITRKFKGGASPEADVFLLKARISKAEATLESRRLQLKRAKTSFLRLTGDYPVDLESPEFPIWAMPESYDSVNLENTPLIKAARANLKISEEQGKQARSAFAPNISLALRNDTNDNARYDSVQEEASALVLFSYDVIDGGRRRHDLSRARSMHFKAEMDYESAVLEVRSSFQQALNELQTSEQRMYQLENYESTIASVVAAYKQQFQLGQRALINVLDVENELFSAQSSVVEERHNKLQAAYRLLAATGTLIEAIH